MKRWISIMLCLAMLVSAVPGDISMAFAAETEVVSEGIEAEAPLYEDTGETGLEEEAEEIELLTEEMIAQESIPETAEEYQEVQPEADTVPMEVPAEAIPEAFAGSESDELSKKDIAEFEFGYAKIAAGEVAVFSGADASSEVLCMLAADDAVLCTGRDGEYLNVIFNTDRGVVSGYVDQKALVPMSDSEINAFMDEATGYDSVVLYNDDLDLPLPAPVCIFAEEQPALEAGEESAEDEPSVEGEAPVEDAPIVDEETVTEAPSVEGEASVEDAPVVDEETITEAPSVEGEAPVEDAPV
ncbi:MAG: hypothetical protein IKM02_02430, partial [Clostridia bacterium]|nr:hypothetical protein [Clostridia bacterium]